MKKVIILGGGVAGMSAAHELKLRGFQVEVFEKKEVYVGGKARSVNVPDSSINGSLPLPGEHGFRFFPGFYRHLTATMQEIPFQNPTTGAWNPNGVADNLTTVSRCLIARDGQNPIIALTEFPQSAADLAAIFYDLFKVETGLEPGEIEFFAGKIWQLMTSCESRFIAEYERMGWWEFTDAANKSLAYKTLLAEGLTRSLVAAQAKTDNTRTCGHIFLQLLYSMLDPKVGADRVLCGPTNQVWLHPWYTFLTTGENPIIYHHFSEAVKLETADGKISGAWIRKGSEAVPTLHTADFYICSMPVERFAGLIDEPLLKLDPTFSQIKTLAENVNWMNGIQFFLNEDLRITDGHILLVDSAWALTAISQQQFWKFFELPKCFDGSVKGVLSVDISDWNAIGSNGKTARECTKPELIDEIWTQLERGLNYKKRQLSKDMIRFVYLDRDIIFSDDKGIPIDNEEPLLVNLVNTWTLRPEAWTAIPNLMLAADYVKTHTDIATMEAANEAARRAVNVILDQVNYDGENCQIWPLYQPKWTAPFRREDQQRFNQGLPYKRQFSWCAALQGAIIGLIYRLFGSKHD